MIHTLTHWELILLTAFVVVVGREFFGLLLARRQGLTQNVSRLVTFATLLVLAGAYGFIASRWLRLAESNGIEEMRQAPSANWGYLLIGVMITVVLAYEISALVHARSAGLTSAVGRLAALLIAVLLLLVMLGISQTKWDLYLERLEATYLESIEDSAG